MNQALLKHFKIAEADAAQIQAALAGNQTFLEALFEKNLIDSAGYLAWAKEHYSLPVLKIDFFNKNNNADALLDRYKNVFPKNVVPFFEMDGTLYVMCLEPTTFEAPQPIQYFLAPFEVMQKYAAKNETSIVPEAAAEVETVKEETNPLFKDLSGAAKPLDEFNFENISLDEVKADQPAPEGSEDQGEIKLEDKEDVPAGLDFPADPNGKESFVTDQPVTSVDLNTFKFDNLMPVTEGYKEQPAPVPAAPTPAPTAAPAPVHAAPVMATPVAPAPVTATPVTPAPVTPKPVVSKQTAVFSMDSLVAKHPPKNKTPAAAPVEAASTEVAPPIAVPDIAPMAPPAPLEASAPAIFSASEETSPAIPASLFGSVLDTMKKHFDQSMVLIFNNGVLEPKAWDANWTKGSNAESPIDVSTPSIFRIVNESQNPYHGHVIPNPVNESFFINWNNGQLPQHVTICPIVHDRHVLGMVLGTATKENSKKFQLHHIQQIAKDAVTSLASQSKAA